MMKESAYENDGCLHSIWKNKLVHSDLTCLDSTFEPHRDKTNEMACAPSEDSDQPVKLTNSY